MNDFDNPDPTKEGIAAQPSVRSSLSDLTLICCETRPFGQFHSI
jgi:hypothetical protein